MMITYSSLRKPVTFMYFWLKYCDENHHIERIPVAVKDIYHHFKGATKSHFTNYSCVIIVLLNTALCRSAFSSVSVLSLNQGIKLCVIMLCDFDM